MNNHFPSMPRPPQRVRCSNCHGSGKEPTWGRDVPCPSCAGMGRDKNSDLWAEPCMRCNGKRFIRDMTPTHPCRVCHGSGMMTI